MVSITNDDGTFTGETERQALANARKGKKAAQKRREEEGRQYNLALADAGLNGFRFLCRLVEGVKGDVLSPRGEFFPTSNPDSGLVFDCFSSDKTALSHGSLCLADGRDVTIDHYGHTFRGAVLSAGGIITGYLLTDDATGRDTFFAVGTHENAFATVTVPGITLEHLTRKPATDATDGR
jgi:hypothetical protein